EEELRLPYDTLWLFPNQRLALLLGHLFLPAADGRASDIERVRLEMRPPETEAAAVAPPKVEAAALAPEAAVAAELPKAAAMSAASLAVSAAAQKPARESGQDSKAALGKEEQNAPPAAAKVAANFSSLQADALRDLDTSMDEINAGLAEAGLPPLSPEQIAATRAEIVRQTAAMEKLQQQIEATPTPELHDVLRQAGVSEQTIAGVDAVMAMEPPDPAAYSDAASWNAAVAKYQADFERSLPLSDEVRRMQRTILQVQGPGGEQVLAQITGPEPKLEEVLVKAGLSPDKAALLSRELEKEPQFNSLTELKTYMSELEKQMDFPPGSMTSVVTNMEKVAAEAGIELPVSQVTGGEAAGAAPVAAATPSPAPAAASQAQNSALQMASNTLSAASLAQTGAAAASPPPPPPPAAVAAATDAPPNLDFSYQDLAGRDFSGQKLDGAIFHDARLAGANFSGASLQNTDFDRADCSEANFDRAKLNNGSFSKTILANASLQGASAESARFIGSDLQQAKGAGLNAKEAEFDGAKLAGASFVGANFAKAGIRRTTASQVNVAQADFSDAALYDSDFSGANFSAARLPRSVANNVRLADSNFTGADLTRSTLMGGSDLSRGNFSGANLKDADWREVVAKEAAFVGSAAEGGRFVACDFAACRWQAARANGADFSHAQLTGADFTGANLMQASLREATVTGASFAKANLYASDLYRVATENADLSGAMTGNTLLAARKRA
ncbi:MAG: pentapeptide repeat-containing protein, partial [Zoogloeaceae bacterium]|nr:pentapeptide repeat-containing protein [Zoogloeaceae bacterium]